MGRAFEKERSGGCGGRKALHSREAVSFSDWDRTEDFHEWQRSYILCALLLLPGSMPVMVLDTRVDH